MYRRLLAYILLLPGCLCCWTACSDDYQYPSASLAFLTVRTGDDGTFRSIVTDDGIILPVLDDQTASAAQADTAYRVISNYECYTDGGIEGARLYSVSGVVAPVPVTADYFEEGVRTDVCREVVSSWPGYGYVNIVLLVKQQGTHSFHFVEDSVLTDGTLRTVHLTLYHAASSEVQDYSKRAYLSIPVWPYLNEEVERINMVLQINMDSGMETREIPYNRKN